MRGYEIINGLKSIAERLDKSPGRREVPSRLNGECKKQFGSFNKAKIKAGLSIIKRKCDDLPMNSYKITKNLVKIASYIMFDGHLYKDLKGFYLSSKDIEPLKDFEKAIKKQFGIKPYYRFNTAGSRKQTHKVFVFNVKATRFLNNIGIPEGDKVITKYDVPSWIKNNKSFSKEFLKIAYFCEGCKYKQSKNSERIQFDMHKESSLIKNGLNFIEDMKEMLSYFKIDTSKTYILNGKIRKRDNKLPKDLKFVIKPYHTNKFIKEIGWYK